MIGAALLAAALFPPDEVPGRLFVVAVAAGVFSAVVADLRAVVVVTGLAMATFVGFLANRYGDLTADAGAWAYATGIGFASALGVGHQWMRKSRAYGDRFDAPPTRMSVPRAGRGVGAVRPDDAHHRRHAA